MLYCIVVDTDIKRIICHDILVKIKHEKDTAVHLWYSDDNRVLPLVSSANDIQCICRLNHIGLFGWHLTKEKKVVVLTSSEADAMAVYQQTGTVAVSLPKGHTHLPQEVSILIYLCCDSVLWHEELDWVCWVTLISSKLSLYLQALPFLESFTKIIIWFDNDMIAFSNAKLFAKKLGLRRTLLVRWGLASSVCACIFIAKVGKRK